MDRAKKILLLALNSNNLEGCSKLCTIAENMLQPEESCETSKDEDSELLNRIPVNKECIELENANQDVFLQGSFEQIQDIIAETSRDCYAPVFQNLQSDYRLPDMIILSGNEESSFGPEYFQLTSNKASSEMSDADFDSDDDVEDPNYIQRSRSCSESDEEMQRAGLVLEQNIADIQVSNLPEAENRKTRKLKRNTGQKYNNSSGKIITEKKVTQLKPCRRGCKTKISPQVQKDIFDSYWKLGNYNLRVAFASGLIIVEEKKTERKNVKQLRNRTHVNSFFLEVHGERTRVCQKCFCLTLCETEQFIKTIVKKKLESPGITIVQDKRGHKVPPNKITDFKENEIRTHIKNFPAYESHYTRKQSEQKYLNADLTLSSMYRLYCEKYSLPVSITTYSNIFKSMNIKFKKPKLDTCNKCEQLQMKIKTKNDNHEAILFKNELEVHQSDADLAYNSKKNDKILAKNDQSIKVFSFDLQQCLPTPFLRTSVSFYKRQLWTFNLTVHDGVTNQAFCYMWHEAEARRGGNEIASCLFQHLNSLPENCKKVVFYSDCCAGQNKNSFLSTMFLIFQAESSIEIIDHKFLVPGHTHMECDTDHAAIERKKKRTTIDIHHPRDWYQFVRTVGVNNPFVVNEMTRDNFMNFSHTLKEKFTWRKVDESGNRFKWQEVKWMRYKKNFGVILYKTTLSEDEPFKMLNIKRRGVLCVKSSDVPACYSEPIKISKEKKKDLLDLLPLIDTNYHSFYENLAAIDMPNYHPDLTQESDDES